MSILFTESNPQVRSGPASVSFRFSLGDRGRLPLFVVELTCIYEVYVSHTWATQS
jgi:hypothetical protein